MQFEFQRSGGLFPGLDVSGTVDLSDENHAVLKSGAYSAPVSPDDARALRDALAGANTKLLTGDLRHPGAQGADRFQYDVKVKTGSGATQSFTIGDGGLNPSVAAMPGLKTLADWIKSHSQQIMQNRPK